MKKEPSVFDYWKEQFNQTAEQSFNNLQATAASSSTPSSTRGKGPEPIK